MKIVDREREKNRTATIKISRKLKVRYTDRLDRSNIRKRNLKLRISSEEKFQKLSLQSHRRVRVNMAAEDTVQEFTPHDQRA